ncbi:MAG TPA: hypothetical protein VKR58_01970 [Aquella sp.]|nr:hypothetical protein [Aquella sp.]
MLKQQDLGKLDSFDNIIAYTESVSNGYDLVPTCSVDDKGYRCQGTWDRYNALKQFYNFVKTRKPTQTLSQWLEYKNTGS